MTANGVVKLILFLFFHYPQDNVTT